MIPLDRDGMRDLLELKNIALLYELWVFLVYNQRFSRSRRGQRHSYSVPLIPDIALRVPGGPNAGSARRTSNVAAAVHVKPPPQEATKLHVLVLRDPASRNVAKIPCRIKRTSQNQAPSFHSL